MQSRMRRAGLFALALSAAAGCAPREPVRVEHAWVRAAESGATTGGYLTLVNDTPESLELTGVTAFVSDSIQVHETIHEAGRVSMREVDRLPVPAHGRLEFRPGGRHLMITRLRAAVRAGTTLDFMIHFADGRQIAVRAEVRS